MRVIKFIGITNQYIEIAFMEYTVLVDARLRKEQERIVGREHWQQCRVSRSCFHESGKP